MEPNNLQKPGMRVAFIVPDICYQTRRILRGIHRYMVANTSWHLRLACRTPSQRIIPVLKKAGVNGAFVSVRSQKIDSELLTMRLPCIGITCLKIPRGLPYITSDSFNVGRVIAEHFIERGFRNFAYYSPSDIFWSQPRKKGFCQRLMVCDDGVGYDLIEIAGEAGIRIPEEVAVMSVDNNEVLCNSAEPPLSSVETNFEQAGYEAAELLDAVMTGQEVMPSRPILGRVARVVVRQSSNVLAINDSQTAAALHFIHKHFNSPIQVSDVVETTYLSRRALEKKFKALMNRSILDEIMRVRIEHIVELLLKSHMSINQIAASSTFNSTSHLIRAFKKHKGMSPRAFRKMHGIT